MKIDIRQASRADEARRFDTEELRRNFLVAGLFQPGEVVATYSHFDRMVIGGAMPVGAALTLETAKPLGTRTFLERRELAVVNVGGAGRVLADGTTHELGTRDALYVAMGHEDVRFESAVAAAPARFYLFSAPAHARYDTMKVALGDAKVMQLGSQAQANERTIYQMILPGICRTSQIVLGMTTLKSGNTWNTMPCHVHDRRSEVYLYFDLAPSARVFHLMGEPEETRHIVVANEQAVISPGWSIHSGVGTSAYTFIWAMAGDNQDYADMDPVAMEALR